MKEKDKSRPPSDTPLAEAVILSLPPGYRATIKRQLQHDLGLQEAEVR